MIFQHCDDLLDILSKNFDSVSTQRRFHIFHSSMTGRLCFHDCDLAKDDFWWLFMGQNREYLRYWDDLPTERSKIVVTRQEDASFAIKSELKLSLRHRRTAVARPTWNLIDSMFSESEMWLESAISFYTPNRPSFPGIPSRSNTIHTVLKNIQKSLNLQH